MLQTITTVLLIAIVVSSVISVYFSIRSRRAADPVKRAELAAKTNVSMGAMLIFISIIQLFWFSESKMRSVIGSVFLLLGLFNLFAGLRNLSHIRANTKSEKV